MDDLVVPVTLFAEPGPQNTEATLRVALERARSLSLKHVVVATDSGKTAHRVLELFPRPPFQVVAVSNPPGNDLPIESLHDYLPRFRQHRDELRAKGVKWVSASLSEQYAAGLQRAGARVCYVDWPTLVEFTRADLGALDRVGVGLRVGLTITVAALLAQEIPPGTDVIALSGTGFGGGGADTALVVRTAGLWRDVRVLETIARPRVSPPSEA